MVVFTKLEVYDVGVVVLMPEYGAEQVASRLPAIAVAIASRPPRRLQKHESDTKRCITLRCSVAFALKDDHEALFASHAACMGSHDKETSNNIVRVTLTAAMESSHSPVRSFNNAETTPTFSHHTTHRGARFPRTRWPKLSACAPYMYSMTYRLLIP